MRRITSFHFAIRSLAICLLMPVLAIPVVAGTSPTTPATPQKIIVKQVFSNGGTTGTNATFTEVGTFGETFVGVRQSADFTVSQGFWNSNAKTSCCVGLVGNVDCDPNDQVDIVDLTVLIDYLFVTFKPLCCDAEANFGPNYTGTPPGAEYRPDIASLTALVDYLFVNFTALPACQN